MEEQYLKNAERLIENNSYLMLSKSWCPDCHFVYRIWDEYGVRDKIHIIELDKMENQEEAKLLEQAFTQISGRKWVPTVFFKGKKLGTEQDIKLWELNGTLRNVFALYGLV